MEKEKELVVMLEVDISSDSLCIYMPVFVFKLVSPNCKFLSYVSCISMRNHWLLVLSDAPVIIVGLEMCLVGLELYLVDK